MSAADKGHRQSTSSSMAALIDEETDGFLAIADIDNKDEFVRYVDLSTQWFLIETVYDWPSKNVHDDILRACFTFLFSLVVSFEPLHK